MTIHPLIFISAMNLAFTLAAGYTTRYSTFRYIAIAFMIACWYFGQSSIPDFTGLTGWTGRYYTGLLFWLPVCAFDRLILRRWDYEHYGSGSGEEKYNERERSKDGNPGKLPKRVIRGNPGSRFAFGQELSSDNRGIGRFWETKNIPTFSKIDPDFVPSLNAFLLRQILVVVVCYFAHDFAVDAQIKLKHRMSPSCVPLLSRVFHISFEDLKTRFLSTAGFWTSNYCLLRVFYSVFAIFSVLAKPEDVRLWRPLFGSPADSYTLRNFWGKSWHQLFRSTLESISDFVAHKVLQLPHRGLFQRYTKIFISFALSGVVHIYVDTGGMVTVKESGALQFFCTQALGIMIEDGVQTVYRIISGRKRVAEITLFERVVGYVWVVAFFTWTSPAWVYPVMLPMKRQDALMSFKAILPLLIGKGY